MNPAFSEALNFITVHQAIDSLYSSSFVKYQDSLLYTFRSKTEQSDNLTLMVLQPKRFFLSRPECC